MNHEVDTATSTDLGRTLQTAARVVARADALARRAERHLASLLERVAAGRPPPAEALLGADAEMQHTRALQQLAHVQLADALSRVTAHRAVVSASRAAVAQLAG